MGSHRVGHGWSDSACLHALEKETAAHSSVLVWRIPGTEESGGLLSLGSHRVGHDSSDLPAAAARFVIAFLPKSKRLLISWLQSLSTVILEPRKIKSVTVSCTYSNFRGLSVQVCSQLARSKSGAKNGWTLQNHLVLATVMISFPLTLSKIEAWCEGSSLSSIMFCFVFSFPVRIAPWSVCSLYTFFVREKQNFSSKISLWDGKPHSYHSYYDFLWVHGHH